ncbi:unnamed protein product [Nesidiocoris tenuis]|uniref:Uncharacterized protein n=1 Tax=Nesidiocoris tenuis TaxID=355587 RepID=A0A6H5FZX6_9HEMI|nr:unnamed protein product [Nesidiocoris tenuis]
MFSSRARQQKRKKVAFDKCFRHLHTCARAQHGLNIINPHCLTAVRNCFTSGLETFLFLLQSQWRKTCRKLLRGCSSNGRQRVSDPLITRAIRDPEQLSFTKLDPK